MIDDEIAARQDSDQDVLRLKLKAPGIGRSAPKKIVIEVNPGHFEDLTASGASATLLPAKQVPIAGDHLFFLEVGLDGVKTGRSSWNIVQHVTVHPLLPKETLLVSYTFIRCQVVLHNPSPEVLEGYGLDSDGLPSESSYTTNKEADEAGGLGSTD